MFCSLQLMSSVQSIVSLKEPITCAGCGQQVCDRFFLLAAGWAWHDACLRCSRCRRELQTQPSLFYRDGNVYCHDDYNRLFSGGQCARCFQPIVASEMVMWSRELSFHPHCFSCQECEAKLLPGNLYYMQGSHLYCHTHYTHTHNLQTHTHLGDGLNAASAEGEESVSSPELLLDHRPGGERVRRRSKRIRTCFGSGQLRALESYFTLKQNPDGKDWNVLAHQTGLSKRVLQVWFQNARAKLRRSLNSDDSQRAVTMTTATSPPPPPRAVTMTTAASSPSPGVLPPDRPLVFPTIDQRQLLQLTSADQSQRLLPSPALYLDYDSQHSPGCISSLEEELRDIGDFLKD
ncbi:LIM/homeobox protein Awh-like isoform X2 [Gouania willdenowi]|uniref:LIM/homeobox protein Awh-like isoform X2 n=1 Tax=Gouania willdenowi TaxID=441366 RepID=UPI0010554D88|nr:LIM/homeobox protein Awh-like isoform X2 [Gouania willdenowi]